VISDEDKRDYVMGLGAKGVINRKDFNCWGQLPKVNTPEYKEWFTEARKFGKAIWDITGKGVNVDMVFEHPGEATFPVSTFVCKRGGMVVICAGTTGFNCTFDARYMWMHQKRLQGSHFAHLKQAAAANKLMVERRLDPCMSEVFPWEELPQAHLKMLRNEHKPGNMSVLVQAPRTGLRTLEDVLEAGPPTRAPTFHRKPQGQDMTVPLRSAEGRGFFAFARSTGRAAERWHRRDLSAKSNRESGT
jgi:crotonyl-CoA carboxylase/reductase